jgi:hypothetical protein
MKDSYLVRMHCIRTFTVSTWRVLRRNRKNRQPPVGKQGTRAVGVFLIAGE